MKKLKKLMLAGTLILVMLLLASCESIETIEDEQTTELVQVAPIVITPIQAKEIMAIGNAVILDVRTQAEFDGGHIENAILLPYDEVLALATSILMDKEQTILIYCRTGRRSNIAALALTELGYTSVYDFGGIVDWHGEVIIP
ncbi:MAG: rhodanese-like domain-containing protein [Defluviitaleaceae bacterium]|nr:rhodanese-like domain-containing protein [Defluviitaleaceae bacterium]